MLLEAPQFVAYFRELSTEADPVPLGLAAVDGKEGRYKGSRKVLAPVVSKVFTEHYFAVHCRLCIFSLSALRAGTKAAQAAQATG